MKIYLDDTRQVPDESWTLTKTVKETIKHLIQGEVEEISLDHDLGDEENETGYDVLLWIEEKVYLAGYIPPQTIRIHTMNNVARKKMEQALNSIVKISRSRGLNVVGIVESF